MNSDELWQRFEQLKPSAEAATSDAIPIESSKSHLLVRGMSGEPVFLLRSRPRATPRAPVRLKHVGVLFDVAFEVSRYEGSAPVVDRYTKFSCAAGSLALHAWFVEIVRSVATRYPGEMTPLEVDEFLESMLQLFREATPPTTATVTGLWGELLAISLAGDREAFVRAWHSGPLEEYDFSFPIARLEVKTTVRPSREHEFALKQVSGGREGDHVLSLVVTRATAGASVLDLAKRVAQTLDHKHAERLWRIIVETLGAEFDGVEDMRYDVDAAKASMKVFPAAKIPAPFVPAVWQGVVTDVEFRVGLGALPGDVPPSQVLGVVQGG